MLTKHPLERPSLAPFGLRTKLSWKRLQYTPSVPFQVFEERMSARFWEKSNRIDASEPRPVETIIHKVLPRMSKEHRLTAGDFEFGGKLYLTRDIVTLSSAVQWFGTNVGRWFVDQPFGSNDSFVKRFTKQNREKDFYAFLAHRCTNRCGRVQFTVSFVGDPCIYDPRVVTERDRIVIDALMRWLDTDDGSQYLARFKNRRAAAHRDADRRRRDHYDRKQSKAA